jgi:hypothetical protein
VPFLTTATVGPWDPPNAAAGGDRTMSLGQEAGVKGVPKATTERSELRSPRQHCVLDAGIVALSHIACIAPFRVASSLPPLPGLENSLNGLGSA